MFANNNDNNLGFLSFRDLFNKLESMKYSWEYFCSELASRSGLNSNGMPYAMPWILKTWGPRPGTAPAEIDAPRDANAKTVLYCRTYIIPKIITIRMFAL